MCGVSYFAGELMDLMAAAARASEKATELEAEVWRIPRMQQ